MNETIRLLKERKSVRVYEEREIPVEIKNEIIAAALEAPSAGGMMLYSIIEISEDALKKKLVEICDHQPFIANASLVLIFLADYQRWYDAFQYEGCEPRKPGEGDLLLSSADAIIAAQNTVVAAESLGIGSCYIGDILENGETVIELLKLPEYTVPVAMVVYGYPAPNQITRKKPPRFEKDYIVFENSYRRLSREEQEKMHQERNRKAGISDKNVAEGIQALCKRKYMSGFSLEMNRSAAEYVKRFHYVQENAEKEDKIEEK